MWTYVGGEKGKNISDVQGGRMEMGCVQDESL